MSMFEGWTAEIQVPTPEAEKGGLEWAGRRLPILDHRPGKGEAEFVLDLEDGQTLVVPESSVQVWNKGMMPTALVFAPALPENPTALPPY